MDRLSKPKKEEDIPLANGQTKRALLRYWLQVDRQTKTAYSTHQEAETAGKAIKTAYPLLQVSVYEAEKSQQTIVTV